MSIAVDIINGDGDLLYTEEYDVNDHREAASRALGALTNIVLERLIRGVDGGLASRVTVKWRIVDA